jgi:hypothetical protein
VGPDYHGAVSEREALALGKKAIISKAHPIGEVDDIEVAIPFPQPSASHVGGCADQGIEVRDFTAGQRHEVDPFSPVKVLTDSGIALLP